MEPVKHINLDGPSEYLSPSTRQVGAYIIGAIAVVGLGFYADKLCPFQLNIPKVDMKTYELKQKIIITIAIAAISAIALTVINDLGIAAVTVLPQVCACVCLLSLAAGIAVEYLSKNSQKRSWI